MRILCFLLLSLSSELFVESASAKKRPKQQRSAKSNDFKTIGDYIKHVKHLPSRKHVKTVSEALFAEAESEISNLSKRAKKHQNSIKKQLKKEAESIFAPMRDLSTKETEDLFDKLWKHVDHSFDPSEAFNRFKHFKRHVKRVVSHNKKKNRTFKMGLNHFSLMSDDEFNSHKMAPLKIKKRPSLKQKKRGRLLSNDPSIEKILASLPAMVNWTKAKKTAPVKNQNNCNGCYAYSALGALESAIMIAYDATLVLSEQEILDCSSTEEYKNNACVGGQPSFVYDYVINQGVSLMSNYKTLPASSAGSQKCQQPNNKPVFKKLQSYAFPDTTIISLLQYLQFSPVAVNHVVPDEFKYYLSGIFDATDCFHSAQIDHSVLLVGYNFNAEIPYFILKNSYGLRWGEAGFYKVPIGPLTNENPGFCYMAVNGYNVVPIVQK